MTGRKPDDYQPRAQIKQMFQEGTLKAGDINAIKDFSEKYIVSEKLVADYIDHLTDIELRKDKRRTENDRKRTARKQQEYNDIAWEDLYHKNQLSTLRVGELELYINHHNILFKGKKDEKVRVVKAHIGSKILTSIVQEKQTNIPLASDSNPEFDSDSDSDRVEGIIAALLDLLVTLQSLVTQEIRQRIDNSWNKKPYLSQVCHDTDGKGHEYSEKIMCHGLIYM